MRSRFFAWTIVATVGLALTGCGTPSASTSPSPTPTEYPTFTCTASDGSPVPCYRSEYDRMEKGRADSAVAVQVYQRFYNESVRLWRVGGTDKATAELVATTGGDYLNAQLTHFKQLKQSKAVVTGEFKLVKLAAVGGATQRGYEAAVVACVDASGATITTEQGANKGIIYRETAYLKRGTDGTMRIMAATGAQVSQC